MDSRSYTERRGLQRQRPRRGGTFFFLFVIGAVVAGAGVAGLEYAKTAGWTPAPHTDNAPPEPSFDPATLTGATYDPVSFPTMIITDDATDAGAATAESAARDAAAAPPKSKAPAAVVRARPAPAKPKPAEALPSEEEIFGKPQ